MGNLVLYISMSLDGYLAGPNDELDFLNPMDATGEEYGYSEVKNRCKYYILGRRTYEIVLNLCDGDFPQAADYECYIISRQQREDENGVRFYSGEIAELIADLKSRNGGDIYCDGGGLLVQSLMEKQLIDEYIISVIPIILGSGKRLFHEVRHQIPLKLQSSEAYRSGLVQLRYKV
jgi:dihydrofolate reductase